MKSIKEKEFMEQLARTNEIIPFSSGGDPFLSAFPEFLRQANHKDKKVLEIGSRNVTGIMRNEHLKNADYVGFDVLEGENVDVVGDAHQLSKYFLANNFDAIFSISVFEHLLMPWKVILEMNRVMKKDGLLFISTHPTWSSHELPWDFWRFQKNSFHALLNKHTGFDIVKLEEGLPCKIISMVDDAPTRGLITQPANLGVSVIAIKTGEYNPDLRWDVPLDEIVDTMYPEKNK